MAIIFTGWLHVNGKCHALGGTTRKSAKAAAIKVLDRSYKGMEVKRWICTFNSPEQVVEGWPKGAEVRWVGLSAYGHAVCTLTIDYGFRNQ